MPPIPGCSGCHPSIWGFYHRSVCVSFPGSSVGRESQSVQALQGPGHTVFRAGCVTGGLSGTEEGSSEVGVTRGEGFLWNEQFKRRVSQWWTRSLQPLEGEQGCARDNSGRAPAPGSQTGKAQGQKSSAGQRKEATGGVPSQGQASQGPWLPSGPVCLACTLGVRQMGILGSNPSFVQLLKIHSLSPDFPAVVRRCAKGSDQQ